MDSCGRYRFPLAINVNDDIFGVDGHVVDLSVDFDRTMPLEVVMTGACMFGQLLAWGSSRGRHTVRLWSSQVQQSQRDGRKKERLHLVLRPAVTRLVNGVGLGMFGWSRERMSIKPAGGISSGIASRRVWRRMMSEYDIFHVPWRCTITKAWSTKHVEMRVSGVFVRSKVAA